MSGETPAAELVLTAAEALRTLLDQVDYTAGACRMTEPVGAVLPKEIIALCRKALTPIPETPECRRSSKAGRPETIAAAWATFQRELEQLNRPVAELRAQRRVFFAGAMAMDLLIRNRA